MRSAASSTAEARSGSGVPRRSRPTRTSCTWVAWSASMLSAGMSLPSTPARGRATARASPARSSSGVRCPAASRENRPPHVGERLTAAEDRPDRPPGKPLAGQDEMGHDVAHRNPSHALGESHSRRPGMLAQETERVGQLGDGMADAGMHSETVLSRMRV